MANQEMVTRREFLTLMKERVLRFFANIGKAFGF